MRSDLHDVQVIFQTTTAKGGLCVRADEGGADVWLRLRDCQIEPAEPRRGQVVTLTAPEGVLIDKGLV